MKGRLHMKKRKEYLRLRLDSGHYMRILAAAAVLGIGLLIVVAVRLYKLMVVDYDFYASQALRNQSRTTSVSADRGTIFDRNMNIMAVSEGVETIYLDPHELRQAKVDIPSMSQRLADLLTLDPQWIETQAKDLTRRYKQIASGVNRETADVVRTYIIGEKILGVHLEPNTKRYYPYGTLAAQVIGFTNASNTGSEGIEASYNSYLSGKSGRVITTKGNNEMDMPFSYENFISSYQGCSVILTLDTTVQACLEKQMEAAIARYDVKNGAFGIVMDVDTGEVLAMATHGSYDPNADLEIADESVAHDLEALKKAWEQSAEGTESYDRAKEIYNKALTEARLKQWRNRCISDGYEPGSTFKVLTMAAALDCGAIDLNTGFYCKGAEQIPGRAQLLHCWRST